jgi:hypothetical protein
MDEAAIERLRIAVRVLHSQDVHGEEVTDAEIEVLKSCLRGRDLGNATLQEIAAAVIRRELNLEPSDSKRTRRISRGASGK